MDIYSFWVILTLSIFTYWIFGCGVLSMILAESTSKHPSIAERIAAYGIACWIWPAILVFFMGQMTMMLVTYLVKRMATY